MIMIQFSARLSHGAVITTLSVTLLTSGFLFYASAGARDFGGGGLHGTGGVAWIVAAITLAAMTWGVIAVHIPCLAMARVLSGVAI